MTILRYVLLAAALVAGGPAQADGKYRGAYCRVLSDAQELTSYTYRDRFTLIDEVRRRYDQAVEVSEAKQTHYTSGGVAAGINPLFLWANEAKTSCAKALGFLRKKMTRLRQGNAETLQKCDCFHARMTYYLGGR